MSKKFSCSKDNQNSNFCSNEKIKNHNPPPKVDSTDIGYEKIGGKIKLTNDLGSNIICFTPDPGYEIKRIDEKTFEQVKIKKASKIDNILNNSKVIWIITSLNISAEEFFNRPITWIKSSINNLFNSIAQNKESPEMTGRNNFANKKNVFKDQYLKIFNNASKDRQEYEMEKLIYLIKAWKAQINLGNQKYSKVNNQKDDESTIETREDENK